MSNTAIGVFKYRLYPARSQEKHRFRVLNCARHRYNMARAERKFGYEIDGRTVSNAALEAVAKHYRAKMPYAQQMFSQTAQSVVAQVEGAFQAFFRRVKAGETPGYPRFKGRNRFHSFLFKQYGSGARIDGKRLKLFGIGRVRGRWHRRIEDTIKTLHIQHKAGQWFALFACEVFPTTELPKTKRVIGLDMGISTLVTTSAGDKVDNPSFYRKAQVKLRVLQRSLGRKKQGGANRRQALLRVQRWHGHIANQRGDVLHKLSTALVQDYDGIALEDLRVRNLVRNHHLSKSILDSGWSMFRQFLTYKAESAGRVVAFVNPAYTSKTCSCCGEMFRDFDLSTRWVDCGCGLSRDRDHNAAINILAKAGWDTSANAHVECGQAHALFGSPCLQAWGVSR